MELELGLKITRTRDDLLSSSEIQLAKNRSGPIFLSRETKSIFILTAYLKGYRKENIDISINEDGTRIAISGERPVRETFIRGWIMIYQREESMKAFRKVFRIPDGVILDRIVARFEDEQSVLTVVMPKRRGISGDNIEEVEDMESVAGTSESMQTVDNNVPAGDSGREMLEGQTIDESLHDKFQAVEEEGGMVEHETEVRETELAQEIFENELNIKQMEGTTQSREENVDKTLKSKSTMPKLPKKEKIHKETEEAEARSMEQIKHTVDVPKDIRELEAAEALPTFPPFEETEEDEYQLQRETDKSSQPVAQKIEDTNTKDVHQLEEKTTTKEFMDGNLDKIDQAIEENVDTVENETEIGKAERAQRRHDGEPTVEQMEETNQARDTNIDSTAETEAAMPNEVPEEESRRKFREEINEPEETNMTKIKEVVKLPEEVREFEDAEAPLTFPPCEQTKEQANQLHKETDKTSQSMIPEIEDMKSKDAHQPEDTTKQEAMKGRLDEKNQVIEENADRVENEMDKRSSKPAQRRLKEEPTTEKIEEFDQVRGENIDRMEETKAKIPSEVPKKESAQKLYEEIEEPEETGTKQINNVVDVPEKVQELEERKVSLTIPPFEETKECENELHAKNVELSQATAPKIEETKTKDVHQPDDQTTKQKTKDGRSEEEDQAVKENVDTVENETEKRKATSAQRRLGEEPTTMEREKTNQVTEKTIDKTAETKATMHSDMREKKRHKLYEDAEDLKETNMAQTNQVMDVPEDVQEFEEAEAPPYKSPSNEIKEQVNQLQEETDKTSPATSPKIEETKTKDVHQPEYKTTKQEAMDERLDHKDQVVKENVDRKENETEKEKAKTAQGKVEKEPTIEHTEEASQAREDYADKIADSKATMPSKVPEKERRKLHEEIKEPKMSMTDISQVVDMLEEIQEVRGAVAPSTLPQVEDTKEHENQLRGKIDKPSQATIPKFKETKTKGAQKPEDQITRQDTMEGRFNVRDQAVKENVDRVEHETERRRSEPAQRKVNREPTIEQMEKTYQVREKIIYKIAETKATMKREVLAKESRKKLYEEAEDPKETNEAQKNQVVDVPGDVQEFEEVEAPPTISPFNETKEQEKQLQEETDKISLATSPKIEEMKTKDIHQPEYKTTKEGAMDERLDHKDQVVEENVDRRKNETETERGKENAETAQGKVEKEPTFEQMEEASQAREENAGKNAESDEKMTSEVLEKERRKLHEEVEEPKRRMTEISQVVDAPEEIQKVKGAEAPPTFPPIEEMKENEKLQGKSDKPSQASALQFEETKTKHAHQPEEEITKQDVADGRFDKKDQALEENADMVEHETDKIKSEPAQRRLDEEPTIEQMEETNTAAERKSTATVEVPQKECREKLYEEREESEGENIEHTNQLVDVLGEIQTPRQAEAPPSMPPFEETGEQANQLQKEVDSPILATPQANEEMMARDVQPPKDQTRKQHGSEIEGPANSGIQKIQKPERVPLPTEIDKSSQTPRLEETMTKDHPIKEFEEVEQQSKVSKLGPTRIKKKKVEDAQQLEDQRRKQEHPELEAHAIVPPFKEFREPSEVQPQREINRPGLTIPPAVEDMKTRDNQDKEHDISYVKAPTTTPKSKKDKEPKEVQFRRERDTDEPGTKMFTSDTETVTRDIRQPKVMPREEDIPEVETPPTVPASQELKEVQQQRETDRTDKTTSSVVGIGKTRDKDSHQLGDERKKKEILEVEAYDFIPTVQKTQKLEEDQQRRSDETTLPEVDKTMDEGSHRLEDDRKKQDNNEVEASAFMPTLQETQNLKEVQPQKEIDGPFSEVEAPPNIAASQKTKDLTEVQQQKEARKSGKEQPESGDAIYEDSHRLEDERKKQDDPEVQASSFTPTSQNTQKLEEKPRREIDLPYSTKLPKDDTMKTKEIHQLKDHMREKDYSEVESPAVIRTLQEICDHEKVQPQREYGGPNQTVSPSIEEANSQDIHQLDDLSRKHDSSDVEAPTTSTKSEGTKESESAQRTIDGPCQMTPPSVEESKPKDIQQLKGARRIEDILELERSAFGPTSQGTQEHENFRGERELDRPGSMLPPEVEKMTTEDIKQFEDQARKQDDTEVETPSVLLTFGETREQKEVQLQKETDIPSQKTPKNIEEVKPRDAQYQKIEKREIDRSSHTTPPSIEAMKGGDIHRPTNQIEEEEYLDTVPAGMPTFQGTKEIKEVLPQVEVDTPSPATPPKFEKRKTAETYQPEDSKTEAPATTQVSQENGDSEKFQWERERDKVAPEKLTRTLDMESNYIHQQKDREKQPGISELEDHRAIPTFTEATGEATRSSPEIPKKKHSTDDQEQAKVETDISGKEMDSGPAQEDMEVYQETTLKTAVENWEDTDDESVCTGGSHDTDEESFYTDESEDANDSAYTDDSREETDEESICVEKDFNEESISVEWEVDECKCIEVEEDRTPEKPGLSPPVIVAGSALFVSIIVVLMRYIRARKR